MSSVSAIERLARDEDLSSALKLVRADLEESAEFKRLNWSSQRIQNRRRSYLGDPGVFAWPYATLNQAQGPRPCNNWTFRQLNHKVGKITRVPTRLNTLLEGMSTDPEVKLRLEAVKQRLLMKARDCDWKMVRRKMATEAGITGLAARAVGLDLSGPAPRIETWPMRPEEYHRDPWAESLRQARYACWRRWVPKEAVLDSLRKSGLSAGELQARLDFQPSGPDETIELPDDLILSREQESNYSPWRPADAILLTDHYRRDATIDIYYTCPDCGKEATVGRVEHEGETFPYFECQTCNTTLEPEEIPDLGQMSKGLRYPYGRHIRILDKGAVIYAGPNQLPIEAIFPMFEMGWYDSDTFVGYSEVELLNSPQSLNNVALAMLSDNAIFNTHPKKVIAEGGLIKPGNNSPDDWIELKQEAIASMKDLPPGQVGEGAKILLQQSIHDMYALAGNDPVAHGAQPETLRSGVGVARVIAASEVSLYLLQDKFFEAESHFFEIVRDLCRVVDTPAFIDIPSVGTGQPTPYAYDRTLMQPNVRVQVVADREIDQEREELFSRALQLLEIGDPYIDWDLMHELSGLPPDLINSAKQRVMARAAGMPPELLQMMNQSASAVAAGPRGAGAGGPAGPTGGAPPPAGMAALRQKTAGARAGNQVRPPERSRGQQTPTAPVGGGMNG